MANKCYTHICEKCIHRKLTVKGLLGNKYVCALGKKPKGGKNCFYFKCEGKDSPRCENCSKKG
ncbi:MAG: hypothetical protein LUI06_04805 [Ruminococcus sp.]|nr:hypothetical protein [Ruminococcus sp.]